MRKWLPAIFVVLISGTVAMATDVTVTQRDWSGGPGEPGPVPEWGARFAASDDVAWSSIPGRLAMVTTSIAIPDRAPFPDEAPGAIKIYATDIDLDGDTDVLGAVRNADRIVLFVNDGQRPPSWDRQVVEDGFDETIAISVADIDDDGLPDILGGSGAGGEIAWWRNLGGSPPQWTRQTVDDQVPGAHDVAGADIDGDGDTDIIAVSYEDDEILWWRNDGGSPIGWDRFVVAAGFDYPTKVSIADIDRDGDLDLFSVAWRDRQIGWWRNDGGDPIAWTGSVIGEAFTGAHWVDAADVDGDGWVDVIGAAMNLGQIAWWRNGGQGSTEWQKITVTNSLSGAVSATAGDLDGDGDLDIAGAGWSPSGGMAWFENLDGDGVSWRRKIVEVGFGESSSAHIADVDGNGSLDVLGSSWQYSQLAWWRVGNFVDHGSLTSSVLDTGGTTEWIDCNWISREPAATALTVEARSSHDPHEMGPWTPVAPGPGCPGLLDGARYLQYRVLLDSTDDEASPIIDEISFTWSPRLAPAPRRSTGRVAP